MLDPQNRQLLLESLRPPDGYILDCAVGTTFSLDLLALLSVPLAFTFSDWEDAEGQPIDNNLALLESVKRHAGHISIFCHAGQINVPQKDQQLFAYLEQSVFEVTSKKKNGVFHPKIWLLRFTTKENSTIRYRFLCLSRNLTYDRSWDTALIMDGFLLQDRQNAFKLNHPLGDFIKSLPQLTESTKRSIPEVVLKRIDKMQDEVRKVQFEMPAILDERSHPVAFDEYRFWPLGLNPRPEWPFDGYDDEMAHRRMLIISPFLSDGFLKRITRNRKDLILVSRNDELVQISKNTLNLFDRKYTLSLEALPEDLDSDSEEQNALSGLHAKLFLMDDGSKARLWTGSANATNAAFPDTKNAVDKNTGNIEFLVELIGPKSKFGIDKVLKTVKGSTSFMDMLEPFSSSDEVIEVDSLQKSIDHELENTRRLIACCLLRAIVTADNNDGFYTVQLICDDLLPLAEDMRIKCWPVTLKEHYSVAYSSPTGIRATFNGITLNEITAFYAFELTLERADKKARERFVVKVNLEGVPDGRFSCLVRSLLKNSDHVLRMFLMLLADQDIYSENGVGNSLTFGSAGKTNNGSPEIPLLESLLRALERDPEKIDRINALVNDLADSVKGMELLPQGFNDIWPAIRSAREGLK
ncbi:MAG: phospholipase D family protein [Deltaproteobacteria bacterium]